MSDGGETEKQRLQGPTKDLTETGSKLQGWAITISLWCHVRHDTSPLGGLGFVLEVPKLNEKVKELNFSPE